VSENRAIHPVATLCRVLGVSSSGYYAWSKRTPSRRAKDNAGLIERVRAIHAACKGTYGAPRIHAELKANGVHVGKKRVARLMRQAGLAGVSRRRFVTTTVRDGARQAPDLVERDFTAKRPNMLWVADITYIPTWAGFLYLAIALDAFSRRIVGWAMATTLHAQLVLDALNMALATRRPKDVIHHSDQGSQGGVKRSSQQIVFLLSEKLVQNFGRCSPTKGLSGSRVKGDGDGCEVVGAVQAEISAFWEVLSQQPIGILVRTALPRAMRITEIDAKSGVDPKVCVLRHLCPLIPGQRQP
jgi:putative transposase